MQALTQRFVWRNPKRLRGRQGLSEQKVPTFAFLAAEYASDEGARPREVPCPSFCNID